MTVKRTFGADHIDCPHCGVEQCFSDWLTDGWGGGDASCMDCAGDFSVMVEFSVTLIATAKDRTDVN